MFDASSYPCPHKFFIERLCLESIPESRLEGGGVNRRNLKFITLNTIYKPGLALEIKPSPKERENKSTKEIEWMTR
jgi:hypothetical protein